MEGSVGVILFEFWTVFNCAVKNQGHPDKTGVDGKVWKFQHSFCVTIAMVTTTGEGYVEKCTLYIVSIFDATAIIWADFKSGCTICIAVTLLILTFAILQCIFIHAYLCHSCMLQFMLPYTGWCLKTLQHFSPCIILSLLHFAKCHLYDLPLYYEVWKYSLLRSGPFCCHSSWAFSVFVFPGSWMKQRGTEYCYNMWNNREGKWNRTHKDYMASIVTIGGGGLK